MEYLSAIIPIAIFFLTIVAGVIGWFVSQMWNRLKANEDKLSDHKLSVAENYVRHDRLQEIIKPMAASISDVQSMVGQLLQKAVK